MDSGGKKLMHKRSPRNQSPAKTIFWFLIELIIYVALVTGYCFFFLLFLRDWLKEMFDAHKALYAFIALALIIAQAVLLDIVIMGLRKLGQRKSK
jgi:tetrahydromethanopterin S-methyltransferase subunit E